MASFSTSWSSVEETPRCAATHEEASHGHAEALAEGCENGPDEIAFRVALNQRRSWSRSGFVSIRLDFGVPAALIASGLFSLG